jgi:uncharacterized membrane protein
MNTGCLDRALIAGASAAALAASAAGQPIVAPAEQSAATAKDETFFGRVEKAVFQVRGAAGEGVTVTGTAFVVDAQGYAITNYHVVEGVQSATAKFSDLSAEVDVELIAVQPKYDLALIRVRFADAAAAAGRPFLSVSQSAPAVGSEVWALGYPSGLGFTVTKGIVSGIREVKALPDKLKKSLRYEPTSRWVQTDCTINSGNSGGPLIAGDGSVVGVNTWLSLIGINQFFALSAEHIPVVLTSRGEKPIGFTALRSKKVVPDAAQSGFPEIEIAADKPAKELITASTLLRSEFKCASCGGKLTVVETSRTGSRTAGGMIFPVYSSSTVSCPHCDATGYAREARLWGDLGRLLKHLVRLKVDDPKADEARDLAKTVLKSVAGLSMDGLSRCLNDRAQSEVTDRDFRIGTPVFATGTLDKDVAVEREGGRLHIVSMRGKSIVLVVSDPVIIDASAGEQVFCGGLLAGRLTLDDGQQVPVLQSGFVVVGEK